MSEVQAVPVTLRVNGEEKRVLVEPRKLLSDTLREDCHLTGTHVGCEHGVCGACTVLVDGRPMRSCLIYAVQMAGRAITTIEGVSSDGQLTPVQQALHEAHGLQCGFCTPGIVLTMEAWLAENPAPERGRDPRCALRQPVPLHRLSQHRRGDRRGGRQAATGKGWRMSKPAIGQSLPRKEDHRFLTGQGRYLDDIVVPGALHAHFVRSPHAHARILVDRHRGRRPGARRRARRHRARSRAMDDLAAHGARPSRACIPSR